MHAILTLVRDAHEVPDLIDHAADRRRVFKDSPAAQPVEPKPLQCRPLVRPATDRARGLYDGDRLFAVHHALSRGSASLRPRISATFLPRRVATARGLVARRSATKVALIMLCGFGLPIDLATTSCTPKASKIARIGPPAMILVPALAARTITRPAP